MPTAVEASLASNLISNSWLVLSEGPLDYARGDKKALVVKKMKNENCKMSSNYKFDDAFHMIRLREEVEYRG